MSCISAVSMVTSCGWLYPDSGSWMRSGRASGSQCETVEPGRIGSLA